MAALRGRLLAPKWLEGHVSARRSPATPCPRAFTSGAQPRAARVAAFVADPGEAVYFRGESSPNRVSEMPVMPATVVALHLSKSSRAPLVAVPHVSAVLETGLEGDRHARRHSRRQVLVVEEEVLNEFGLAHGAIREQVTVRGLALDGLVLGARLR